MKLILTLFKRNLLIFLFLISLISFSSLSVSKHNAVVVTRHHLATEVGSKILQDGGNAFDAAISVAFALAVVNPSAGNIGGGGFALLYDANKKTIESIDYRERAPIKAKKDMFLDENGVPFMGGTYFPKVTKNGLPSFKEVLQKVYDSYKETSQITKKL